MAGKWRQIGLELARAIAVLALVWLNFGHAPLSPAAGLALLPDGSLPIFCGQAPVGEDSGHGTDQCDACRLAAGLALPDAPIPSAQPADYIKLARVRPAILSPLGAPARIAARPRAPPLSA